MGVIKVIDQERRHPQDVEFAPYVRWLTGIAATVLAGLLVGAISGNIVMYGEQRQMREAIIALTKTLDVLAKDQEKRWDRYDIQHEEMRLQGEQLKLRIALLDKQGGSR